MSRGTCSSVRVVTPRWRSTQLIVVLTRLEAMDLIESGDRREPLDPAT